MRDTVIIAENLVKEYRLGAIGGGTLKGDLQSFIARKRGKEDPNMKIGATGVRNERFRALDGVSFSVEQGDTLGIIGRNGAGKSTLLKLLSRVTAPTEGTIKIKGRIASMLEVGTGFHPELTGRENVYLNGAILGMTKAEVTRKFDEIVAFAEMEKFIDTPVKRYSSGMYVKLAFAVAAHLDSEILVMDEVLAVGDMKFQQKCLGKMGDVASREGRTVLYVSHNMNTISQLCNRCIVLDHGKVVLDGNVDEAIGIYTGTIAEMDTYKDLDKIIRHDYLPQKQAVHFTYCEYGETTNGNELPIRLNWKALDSLNDIYFRFEFRVNGNGIATAFTEKKVEISRETAVFVVDIRMLIPSLYEVSLVAYKQEGEGVLDIDAVKLPPFRKASSKKDIVNWNTHAWGHVRLPDIIIGE